MLLLEHLPMLKTLGKIALAAKQHQGRNPDHFLPAVSVIPAPSEKLINAYLAWVKAPNGRYDGILPPHLFSQWALPVITEVLEQSRYALAGVLNQGCTLTLHQPLPRGQALHLRAELLSIEESEGRARLSIKQTTGTAQVPCCVEAVFHLVFITGKKAASTPRASEPETFWHTQGGWRASADDGLGFAQVTGDFNPIHWIDLAGKLSPFKQKVLHGFGMFTRSYEVLLTGLQHRGLPAPSTVDVRFLKPVPLPSKALLVQTQDQDHSTRWRLVDAQGKLHFSGTFS